MKMVQELNYVAELALKTLEQNPRNDSSYIADFRNRLLLNGNTKQQALIYIATRFDSTNKAGFANLLGVSTEDLDAVARVWVHC
jgi:hypothetical protein